MGEQMKTAVSLFAGVGGFDLALQNAGVKVVASVEIDKKAQDVLRRHFPDSTIFGAITPGPEAGGVPDIMSLLAGLR